MPKQGFESVTIPEEIDLIVEDLAKKLNKPKSQVVAEAIRYFNKKLEGAP